MEADAPRAEDAETLRRNRRHMRSGHFMEQVVADNEVEVRVRKPGIAGVTLMKFDSLAQRLGARMGVAQHTR